MVDMEASTSHKRRRTAIHESFKARVIQNYGAGCTQLCQQDIENIRSQTIKPNVTEGRNSELVEAGWNELTGKGTRFRAAFPTVLPASYNESLFLFPATDRQRTVASLQGFAEGAFGEWQNVQLEPFIDPDLLLKVKNVFALFNQFFNITIIQPNDDCPLQDDVRGNFIELDAFEAEPEYAEMLDQVNRKLGFFGADKLRCQGLLQI